jgi:hypothetical protein
MPADRRPVLRTQEYLLVRCTVLCNPRGPHEVADVLAAPRLETRAGEAGSQHDALKID